MNRMPDERGETSAQIAVLAPVLFTCAFAVVHVAAYWMSALSASAAATRGARAASMGSPTGNPRVNALLAVEDTVSELSVHLEEPPRIEIDHDNVVVTVNIRVPGVVPLFPEEVSRSVRMRREQFVRESGR